LLEGRHITWSRGGRTILSDVSIRLPPGSRYGLVGPNGSGKSSLLKILAFLERPTSGEIVFRGEFVKEPPLNVRRQLAIVFQEPLLFNASVFENIAAGLRIRRVARMELHRRVDEWLERFGIGHLRYRPARTLSGGEAQRVSLARALVLEPEVLLLDEPFAALDAPTRENLVGDLGRILSALRTTVLLVSHDLREVGQLTERAVVLIDGQVAGEGAPAELISFPPVSAAGFLAPWRVAGHDAPLGEGYPTVAIRKTLRVDGGS